MQIPLFEYYKKIIEKHIPPEHKNFVCVEPPKDPSFGDFSTSIAMILSKITGRESSDIALDIYDQLKDLDDFEKLEIRKPGFINWFVSKELLINHLPNMLNKDYGKIDLGSGRSVNIEYVSANPTGPIHAGHVRGAVSGDILARLLDFVGYRVTKEFYINDAGKQVEILAKSLYHRYSETFTNQFDKLPDWAYPGEYLIDIARKIKEKYGDKFLNQAESEWIGFFQQFAISSIMADIKKDLTDLGVNHDVFSSETELTNKGTVERAIEFLKSKNLIYQGTLAPPKGINSDEWKEREQLLFRSTAFGDDVDRPLQKSDGSWTYFASDIAYHMDKIDRGFDEMIDFWGADHGGYKRRMQAAVSAISDNKKKLDVKIVQLVRLLEDGKEAKMSKRAGSFVTARDIMNKVGRDVVRFMMITRRDDVSLDFDFKKVIELSKENPVFYVQYAYARTHSIIKQFQQVFVNKKEPKIDETNLNLLDAEHLKLIKVIADWPRQIIMAAKNREPHRVALFLIDLAAAFHFLWNQGKDNSILRFIISDDFQKTSARIVLIRAIQNIMELAFSIMGISPTKELR
ncbi:MAG: arginine--tRNA ligase [Holosporaceae bacterium]|jgi:arginyl-tRNA synthetase|nr:arginine--tRNA ligase [Holosporaceae bacterium]